MSKKLFIIFLLIVIIVFGAAIYFSNKSEEIKEPEKITVDVYFGNTEKNPNMQDCSKVYPVERETTEKADKINFALNELFSGPTAVEKEQGYTSWFSAETRNILNGIAIKEGTAFLNIKDIRQIIPGASSSCGSAQLLAEIESTLKQFSSIDNVIIGINSDPKTFYEWIQVGCTKENNFCDDSGFTEKSTIEGSLGYPSEGIPEDVKVCAENINTEKKYCTTEHIQGDKYKYGVGYKIEVPAGKYYVLALRSNLLEYRAYYTEFVTCGMTTECKSHKKITVEVDPGQTVSGINPIDWSDFPLKNQSILEKEDLIMIHNPSVNEVIESPYTFSGQARGTWYFEGDFPVEIHDGDGKLLATDIASSKGEWMTEDFVPFSGSITFDVPSTEKGTMVFKKDNPSGLPENDNQLIIPIYFK